MLARFQYVIATVVLQLPTQWHCARSTIVTDGWNWLWHVVVEAACLVVVQNEDGFSENLRIVDQRFNQTSCHMLAHGRNRLGMLGQVRRGDDPGNLRQAAALDIASKSIDQLHAVRARPIRPGL